MNTELLLQTVHSVNQISLYGAFANWCYQVGLTEEEKGRVAFLVDSKQFDHGGPRRSGMVGIFPTQASGNGMQEGAPIVQTLEQKIQLSDRRDDV